MINFQNTLFVGSFTNKNEGAIEALPEIIFIGRSNVGKSSLINAIINRKNLAYTSKKPGFTKLLNYYNVDDTFYLVDAPGYGFAKREKDLSASFATMMNNYFNKNTNLSMIYLLIDSRRTLTADDEAFLDFV
ncbi:MAG TPA: ribosome biogenesis GTP-binding protein YihA/YsxC, partial [Bacilli bacterium]|nr:ribosome biogenesis GTP-binding protein YihA/YsxC [Bacilli bacterium]